MLKDATNWPEDRNTAIRAMWENTGMSASEIAAKMSVLFDCVITRNAVIGRARRMNLKKRSSGREERIRKIQREAAAKVRRRPPSRWDSDRDARLRVLWGQGRSAQFIAEMLTKEFGMEVNGKIAGQRANRLGLARRKHMAPDDAMETAIPRRSEAWSPIDGHSIALTDLSNDTCHWPLSDAWDTSATGFCGKPVHNGVYCQHHHGIAYRALEPKEKRLEGLSRVIR